MKANPDSNTWQVGQSSDDCYRRLVSSYFSLVESDCYCGDYSSTSYDYSSGMRFTNLNIPKGSAIDSAYLQLKAYTSTTAIPATFIEGQNSDDTATFSTAADYDARPRTSAVVSWTPSAWVINVWYNSSDIKTVVQEIVNRAGWASGNALVLFWRDAPGWGGAQKRINAYSYDGEAASAPKLEVTWTEEEGDTSPPTYSDVGTNTTLAGQPCLFYTKWADETGLATTGGFIFGTNNTGSWQNETWSAFTANPDWSNVTKTLNVTIGIRIEWRVWANDTSNNWNNTGTQFLVTEEESPEEPPTVGDVTIIFPSTSNLRFQNDITKHVTLTIQNGTLNCTNPQILLTADEGKFVFTALEDTTIQITYQNISSVKVYGDQGKENRHVNSGDVLTIDQNDKVTIYWYFPIEPLLPLMFILGMFGLASMFGGPIYAVHLFKHHEYRDAFVNGTLITAVGFALVIAWLWI